MHRLVIFLKKNKVTQFILSSIRVFYFFTYRYYSRKLGIKILGPLETVKMINSNRLSISRFGDGEFNIAFENKGIGFQPYSKELQQDLINVLQESNSKKYSIGLPHGYNQTKYDKLKIKPFWWSYVTRKHEDILNAVKYADKNIFLDASFTRTITELRDKSEINEVITEIKRMWKDRDVLIVEGSGTGFGKGNDLLQSCRSVSRIIAPAVDAYSKIEIIRNSVEVFLDEAETESDYRNKIVLIALGPTATVLAAELNEKVQTIDIGHFDLQYEYFQRGYYNKVAVDNKYDNEMIDGDKYTYSENSEYESQIVKRID
ncbi:DUF1792 domain-containing protein [Latilactobacillus sakei]|uniref:GT-D fold domain-containing glycosyltransferase n=1 Tax=Latilactobacillus sakei TaxID=1599 RepID=UPI001F4C1FB1|nr:GT-D fold domain-containing glycosyltransferase [Latilactobacillus sakei]UNC19051.1 DUF1792 domain-containing protein [Latilactobacillus sakei]